MKYGVIGDVKIFDESATHKLEDCLIEVGLRTPWNMVPRIIEALRDEPIAHLLGEGDEAEFSTQGNSIQCSNCGDWFTVENMPPRYCPYCGARFTNEVG